MTQRSHAVPVPMISTQPVLTTQQAMAIAIAGKLFRYSNIDRTQAAVVTCTRFAGRCLRRYWSKYDKEVLIPGVAMPVAQPKINYLMKALIENPTKHVIRCPLSKTAYLPGNAFRLCTAQQFKNTEQSATGDCAQCIAMLQILQRRSPASIACFTTVRQLVWDSVIFLAKYSSINRFSRAGSRSYACLISSRKLARMMQPPCKTLLAENTCGIAYTS